MKRREFIKNTGALLAASPFMNFASNFSSQKRMIVLGMDGMDPLIVYNLMKKGELPNLRKLAEMGSFTKLRTTIPPQSPVAWSSFVTGADPGVYGIYDFIHRDPSNYFPIFSQSETIPSEWIVKIGKYKIPLKSGKVVLKREGTAFWDYLEKRDIEATIFKVPGNYPPSKSGQRTISGMGTPDITGGYGMYTLYTTDEEEAQKDISPSHLYYAYVNEHDVMEDGIIEGPANDLIKESESISVPFKVYLDYTHKTARIDVQGKEILISEKEYSDWVEIEFPLIKNIKSIYGMVKFYLLEVGKRFRLYISPVHVSPAHPAMTISTPSHYSKELAEKNGLFHTISLPADTKALSQQTFSMENFLHQNESVFSESEKIFDYEFQRFLNKKKGFLFFYFSELDQGQHMMWALNDKQHPYFHTKESKKFWNERDELYRKHDRILGKVLKKLPKDVPIIVMSDHGFAPFRRKVNINTWLYKEGYLKLSVDNISDDISILEYADWNRTKSYAIGLNGLYINLKGREREGVVTKTEKRKLLEEIKSKLEMLRDPLNGKKVISNAYISEDHFSKDFLGRAPDIIIGYNRGYRTDDSSAIGNLVSDSIKDNLNWWSGDHCVDPMVVPATFISNFKINKKFPAIKDITPTILKHFGIKPHPSISGESLI